MSVEWMVRMAPPINMFPLDSSSLPLPLARRFRSAIIATTIAASIALGVVPIAPDLLAQETPAQETPTEETPAVPSVDPAATASGSVPSESATTESPTTRFSGSKAAPESDAGGTTAQSVVTAEQQAAIDAYMAAIAAMREFDTRRWETAATFNVTDPSRQAELKEKRKRWMELGYEGLKIREEMLDAAEAMIKIFGKNPPSEQAQGVLGDALMTLAWSIQQDYEMDLYEKLGQRCQTVLEVATATSAALDIHEVAGVSAMANGDYEKAIEMLNVSLERLQEARKGPTQRARVAYGYANTLGPIWEQEKMLRVEESKRDDLPRVRFLTTRGSFIVELFEDHAPGTVANFISLVESGFYNDNAFHLAVTGMMTMTGDPKGDGTGGPAYRIADEHARPDARHSFRGSLIMAKQVQPHAPSQQGQPHDHEGEEPDIVPDSAGSQFCIAYIPLPGLDKNHTVFGRVVEGMDVVSVVTRLDPKAKENAREKIPDRILSAEVIRKRDHPYVPVIVGRVNR
jgi:cyclophilin family peptidyl-prolyl cis-trans isomerase